MQFKQENLLRRRLVYKLLIGGLAACFVALPDGSAFAYYQNDDRTTADTAFTHGGGNGQLGLWTSEVGIIDRLDLGSYVLPWFFHVANLSLKYEYRATDKLSFSPKISVFSLDVQKLNPESPPLKLSAVPLEFFGSYLGENNRMYSLGIVYTKIEMKGSFDQDALQGAAAVSNLQFVGLFEEAVSKTCSFYIRGRYLAHQWQPSASVIYVQHPNEYTTVEVIGAGSLDTLDVKNAYSIVPGFSWSFKNVNFRVGLGYGNMNIGGVNIVLPKKTLVPDLDFFYRW